MTTENGSADAGNPATTPVETPPVNTPTPEAWHSGFEDADLKSWVENKGYHKLSEKEALKAGLTSYRHMEKLFGADKAGRTIEIPADMEDKASRDAFYQKLGRPESPDKYELSVPEGVDPEFSNWAKSTFHEMGLTAAQGKALAEKWNAYVGESAKTTMEAYQQSVTVDEAALKKEWGAAFDNRIGMAKKAAREFVTKAGMGADVIDKLEDALGYGGLMKFFSSIGEKLGEDTFVSSDASSGFGAVTPAQAKAKLDDLLADKEFQTRYLSGEATALARVTELQRMMAA